MKCIVHLDIFEGPLDLLLFLIEKNEIEILNIPIAEVTEQYLRYIKLMENLDLHIASEYFMMAAKLLYIKSLMLIPRKSIDGEIELEGDPRESLVRQLLEYKKYKEMAIRLSDILEEEANYISRQESDKRSDVPVDTEEVELYSLVKAFRELMKRAKAPEPSMDVFIDESRILEETELILKLITSETPMSLERLMRYYIHRDEFTVWKVIIIFISLLYLMRDKKIIVFQDSPYGRIMVRVRDGE